MLFEKVGARPVPWVVRGGGCLTDTFLSAAARLRLDACEGRGLSCKEERDAHAPAACGMAYMGVTSVPTYW